MNQQFMDIISKTLVGDAMKSEFLIWAGPTRELRVSSSQRAEGVLNFSFAKRD